MAGDILNDPMQCLSIQDFRVSPDDPEPDLAPPHFNRLGDILAASDKIEKGEEADAALLQILRQGSSMGGARPKCTVEFDDAIWIAKFPSKNDFLDIPCIEYATMSLAAVCGIKIPEIRIVNVAGKNVFLIKRFDRINHHDGWIRKGFISALSLMQWDEKERLLWDYPYIADTMRKYTDVNDINELFRRMVFNILVRNTDDHPRNHGFLYSDTRLYLSPAYDIVPTPVRAGISSEFSLAMSIGRNGRNATLKNAMSRAGRFGLSNSQAEAVIKELSEKIKKWRHHFEEYGVSDRDINFLAPSFSS